MKNLISFLFSLLFFINLSAQTIDPANQKLIESFVKRNIDVQLEEVDQTTVNKVFFGTFYKIKAAFIVNGNDVSSFGGNDHINVNGSTVNMIDQIFTDTDCPILMSLLNKDFLLKDENAAKEFEDALNILYPADEDDISEVKNMHKDPEWIFIRGKFFDDYKAFIVVTDADGAITKIEFRLGYSME